VIDVAALLRPVTQEAPCGENLEYDPAFGAMERSATGKPEQQFGSKIIPAEPPDWRSLRTNALEVLGRTRDLRAAVLLARAELAGSGLTAFAGALQLICGYIQQYWEFVHPQLDPEDNNDPSLRVNTLEALCDSDATLQLLRLTPLVVSRKAGRFSLHDVAIADGEVTAPAGASSPPDWAVINAAFADCDPHDLTANAEAVQSALQDIGKLEREFASRVGSFKGVSLQPLRTVLNAIDKVYVGQLSKRGLTPNADSADAPAGGAAGSGPVAGGEVIVQKLAGQITSRDDVMTALDKICQYYAEYEPSSPLPLMLQRCRRLVTASFLEIIQDVIPEAISQAESIGGRRAE
jgi:type VI secretion system protein ImpA